MMGKDSKISWTDHTFSPVRGCVYATLADGTVSRACLSPCYAEAMSLRNPRTLGTWGPDGARSFGAESYWRQPVAWNRDAEAVGEVAKVFCASLADIGEGRSERVGDAWGERRDGVRSDYLPMLSRLWTLMGATPWLRWLLLSKRPWNLLRFAEEHGWPETAWAGMTAEGRPEFLDRIDALRRIPARVRFLSMEPLYERVDIRAHLDAVHWVIVGGNSAPGAPPLDLDAVRDLRDQCRAAGRAFFCKQLGIAWARANGSATRAGTDPAEWPEDLRVQDFPDDGIPVSA